MVLISIWGFGGCLAKNLGSYKNECSIIKSRTFLEKSTQLLETNLYREGEVSSKYTSLQTMRIVDSGKFRIAGAN